MTITDLHAGRIDLDDRDADMIAGFAAKLNARPGPRVGDFVRFTGGAEPVLRRISYIWEVDDDPAVQTSPGGSYHLGDGYVSMSGGCRPPVPASTLTLTDETRPGRCWTFHHNQWRAGNAVEFTIPFRVFTCPATAP